ncbi:MAG: ABC transporter substrate-binding protein [Alphaproteobacteria bacterium]|nr:ABC transporter substrate-binding protein [Alphaproteobacteria bacterium]
MRTLVRRIAAILLVPALLAGGAVLAQDRKTLTLAVTLEPPHLDPTAGAAAAIDEIVYANVFEGLTRIDETGAVKPQLATTWDVSADGKTYTFHLRPGARFHDGKLLESAHVVFSMLRAVAPDSANAQKGLFEPIESVEAKGLQTVVIRLKRPEGGFLFSLSWGDMVIVHPDTVATNKEKPVGTGPFKFASWTRGDRVVLEKADARAKLDRVVFRFIADPQAMVSELMAGSVDGTPNLNAPEAFAQFGKDARFEAVAGTTEGETLLSINNARKPFDSLLVRRALSHAIDRKALVEAAMFGHGTPIGSHFAPHHPAYVDLTGTYTHDVAKARALLKQAGVENLEVTIKLPPPPYARRGGEVIAAQLAEAGIRANLVPVEWAQWLEQVFKGGDFDLTIVSHTEPLDIGIYGRDKYYFAYNSDAFRALMTELAGTADQDKRYDIYRKAQRLLAEDTPAVFLFELAKLGVWKKGVAGLWHNSPVQANDVTAAYWK